MVLVKIDPEAISETQKENERGQSNSFIDRDKEEDEESVESHCTDVSINRPCLTPESGSELSSCPVCTYPCWNCRTTTESLPRVSTPVSEDSSRSTDPPKSAAESISHGVKMRKQDDVREYIGPKHEQFAMKILQQCARLEIRIRGSTALIGDIIEDSQNPTRSNVILNISDQRLSTIANDINAYHFRCYDENSLAFVLVDSLLKRDNFTGPGGPKATISLRRDKWRIPHAGPQIGDENQYYYDWDVESDAIYMISMDMFDHHQRGKIAMTSELSAEPYGVCPYLTIDYMSMAKGGKPQDAVNQVAAAAIIWLKRRRNLRKLIGSIVYIDLKHYAFTFASKHVTIWEASCTQFGYLLWELDECSLATTEGLRSFVQWSNAIHAWGLGPNATAFKEDAEEFLQKQLNLESF